MRKMMYNQALFILHEKCQSLTFSRSHRKRRILLTLKRKPFQGLENAELLYHCSFYTKIKNFGFVLFHLKWLFTQRSYNISSAIFFVNEAFPKNLRVTNSPECLSCRHMPYTQYLYSMIMYVHILLLYICVKNRYYHITSIIRQFFSFQNNPKNLDPSYMTDLNRWIV